MGREQLFAAFFFAVFLLLLYQLFLLLAPFAAPLFWAVILSLTFAPLTPWLVLVCRGSRTVAAAVLLLAVTAGAIVPCVYFATILARETAEAYRLVETMARDGQLEGLVASVRASRPGQLWQTLTAPFQERIAIDPAELIVDATRWLSQQVAEQGTQLARNLLRTLFSFVLMLVALFFFFRDGEPMAQRIADLVPMAPEHKRLITRRLYDTLTAVVQSMLLTAVVQGVLGGLGYWLIGGLTLSVFLAFLTGLASFVPMAGPALVWMSVSIYLAATGSTGRAIGLFLWGALVVSMADNVIKPLFISGRAKLPTFLLLFGILGGLTVYGFMGIFIAPVLVALLLAFVDIYRELYHTGSGRLVTPSTK